MRLHKFFEEIKRRHVMRVTGLYLLGAWAIIQVAATVFPLLGWGDSAAKAVVIIAILGVPVVILLSWFFDVTPQGIQRTPDAPESVLETASVADQIEAHRRRFAAQSVGFVGVGILVALVGFAAYGVVGGGGNSGAAAVESIAVLPFRDLSANHDQEYFSDGVSEELLNRLAQVEGLRVAGRTSSFAFKDRKDVGADQIGRELRVQAVVEGSVRREGDDVRVSARLVNARTGGTIWAHQYQVKDSSMFAVQDEIASAIVDALKMELTPATKIAASEARGTRNAAAQDFYFKGLKAWNDRTDAQLQVALRYFEQAADVDTTFALAYAGMAKTYAVLPVVSKYPIVDALTRGTQAAARALALDPVGLSDAHAALGQLKQNLEWDLTSALRDYRRAVKINPKDAVAHQWYAEALMLTGDLQNASSEIESALQLDPSSPAARSVKAYIELLRGNYPQADSAYQALVRAHPGFRVGALNYAFAAFMARDYSGAAEGLIAALPSYAPDVGTLIAAASGQSPRTDAVRAIDAMMESEPPSVIALLFAAVGAHDRALQVLDAASKAGEDANFPYVLVHPLLTPLRAQQQFQQIVRSVGVTIT